MVKSKFSNVTFETIKAEMIDFGNSGFIEVARKKIIGDEGEKEFFGISRGYFMPDGSKNYRKSVTIPIMDGVREKVAKKLLEV